MNKVDTILNQGFEPTFCKYGKYFILILECTIHTLRNTIFDILVYRKVKKSFKFDNSTFVLLLPHVIFRKKKEEVLMYAFLHAGTSIMKFHKNKVFE